MNFLLRISEFQKAEKAMKFYKGYRGISEKEDKAFFEEFERLKSNPQGQKTREKIQASDFCKLLIQYNSM